MLGMTRWNSVDDFFTFQRQLEAVFAVPQFLDLEKISASYRRAASISKASQTRDRSRRPRKTLVLM